MHHLRIVSLFGLALLVTACGKKPAPVTPAPESAPAATRPTDSGDEAARRAAEEAAQRRAEEERRSAEVLGQMVFFDYDVSRIRPDQRPVLDAKVPLLRDNPSLRIRVEGHADDRGSTEYNLALGTRRAEAIREYLVGFGLDASRFETVSYGEERPLVQGQGETSWARNRRGEFVIIGGQVVTSDDGR